MKQKISEIVSDLVTNLKTYIISKIDLYLLHTFEKFAKVQSTIISVIILVLIGFFCLFFITISIALWIGSLLNNFAIGFLFMGGFYFLLGLIFIIFRKFLIEKRIIKSILTSLFNKEKNNSL
jgi:hypothetical protein